MTDDELEEGLRLHFREIDPTAAPTHLRLRIDGALDARSRRPTVTGRTRPAFAVVVAAVVLVAVGLAFRPGGFLSSPLASPSPTQDSTSPTESAESSLPPVAGAAVDQAGTFAAGGLWAVHSGTLLVSMDGGATWRRSPVPVPRGSVAPVFLLDSDHGWSITFGPGSTGFTGAPTDVLNVVVHRTVDGGQTWQESAVPGNWAGTSLSLVFVDPQHGFLFGSAMRHSSGVSIVRRTDDGGTTWTVPGTADWLGSMFAATDVRTLWSGAEQEAGPVSHPILDVSHDGGRVWADARLPGLEGHSGGGDTWLAGPPLFFDPDHGLVTVVSTDGNGNTETRIYQTTDGGQSWSIAADQPVGASAGVSALDADNWLLPVDNPIGLLASQDGGRTWQDRPLSMLTVDEWMIWVGAVDATHVAALVPTDHSDAGPLALYLSSDAGKTWQPADFGTPPRPSSSTTGTSACSSTDVALSSGSWGPAGGTTYAILHATLIGNVTCALPTGPAVEIVDSNGSVLVQAPGSDDQTVLLTSSVDLRLGWSSWCAAPRVGPLTLRLTLSAGVLSTALPSGFSASCQGVPTVLFIEPVSPAADATPNSSQPPVSGTQWAGLTLQALDGGPVGATSVTAWSGGYVALGQTSDQGALPAWVSQEGHSWHQLTADTFGSASTALAGPCGDGVVVAIKSPSGESTVWRSTNGRVWTPSSSPGLRLGRDGDLAGSRTGAVAILDGLPSRIAFSPDCVSWETASPPGDPPSSLQAVAAFGTGFVAVGDTTKTDPPIAWSSTDGLTWLRGTVGPGQAHGLYNIAVGGQGLVASGSTGDTPGLATFWTSSDGHAWTVSYADPLGLLQEGEGVGGANGAFLGDRTRILGYGSANAQPPYEYWISVDGNHWTKLALTGDSASAASGDVTPMLLRDGVLFSGATGSWFGVATP